MSAPEYEFKVDRLGATLQWQGSTFQLEAEDLANGGWMRTDDVTSDCIDGKCTSEDEHSAALELVERLEDKLEGFEDALELVDEIEQWHANEGHFGGMRTCDHVVCKATGRTFAKRFD